MLYQRLKTLKRERTTWVTLIFHLYCILLYYCAVSEIENIEKRKDNLGHSNIPLALHIIVLLCCIKDWKHWKEKGQPGLLLYSTCILGWNLLLLLVCGFADLPALLLGFKVDLVFILFIWTSFCCIWYSKSNLKDLQTFGTSPRDFICCNQDGENYLAPCTGKYRCCPEFSPHRGPIPRLSPPVPITSRANKGSWSEWRSSYCNTVPVTRLINRASAVQFKVNQVNPERWQS